MKLGSVESKLGKFKSVGNEGAVWYYSRVKTEGTEDRLVKVIDQGNSKCIALPVFQNKETGEVRVAFHATTVKSLVEFLENKENN